jgi:hypothetical protein
MPISGIAMLATMGLMAVVPAVDMWLPRRARRPGAGTDDDDG